MTLREWLVNNKVKTYFWVNTKGAGMGYGSVDNIEKTFSSVTMNNFITLDKKGVAHLSNGMTFKIESTNDIYSA